MPRSKGVLILTFAVCLTSAGILLNEVYAGLARGYARMLLTEEYCYLIVLIPISLYVMMRIFLENMGVQGINVFRVLVFTMLTSMSFLTYCISAVIVEYSIELMMLSLVFVVWAMMTLFFKPANVSSGVLLMLTPLLLVPIPRTLIDESSASLTAFVAQLTSVLTGSELYFTGNMILIRFLDSEGITRYLEIAPVCSGIISVLAVLSILPLIIYMVLKSRSTLIKKIAALAASAAVSLTIVFFGNIIRIASIVWISQYWSYDLALNIFHQTPSVIYAAIAALASVLVAQKILGDVGNSSKGINLTHTINTQGFRLLASMLLLALTVGALVSIVHGTHYTNEELKHYEFDSFIENLGQIIFSATNATLISEKNVPSLGEVLGETINKQVIVRTNTTSYFGYLEVAEIPTRFHGWQVCLTAQGYKILRSWTEVWDVKVNFMLIEKNSTQLLGYAVFEVPVKIAGLEETAYVRVSLFTPANPRNYQQYVNDLRNMFSRIHRKFSISGFASTDKLLSNAIMLTNALVIINIVALSFAFISKFINKSKAYLPTRRRVG